MSSKRPAERAAWRALERHKAGLAGTHLRDLFAPDSARFKAFHISLDGLLFDYSKHMANAETMALLAALAVESGVETRRDDMFAGAPVNTTENRPALHTALRGSVHKNIKAGGEEVGAFVDATLARIKAASETIRSSGVTDVVNIGIGGSDIGPRMVCEALRPFADGPRVHFVSNVDGADLAGTLAGLVPAHTAFIIASKTFTTLETMANARSAQAWSGGQSAFYAATANEAAAQAFGIEADRILPLRDWVGGRYSLWSATGLSIAVGTGFANFEKLLQGAAAGDEHFKTAKPEANIPVIMAMLGIWYRNFWGYAAHAVLPYAQDLRRLPQWAQQLDMESNGKTVDRDGRIVDYPTSPVVFGDTGTNAQHAFFQLLHQGTDIIPCDFIAAVNPEDGAPGHHEKLLGNMLAQAQALMDGNGHGDEPYRKFDGNRPSTTILLERLDPWHLGLLLALYEHKTFVQGVVWNLNSFDQWGVELGKKLARDITETLENSQKTLKADASTAGLAAHIHKTRK